MPWRVFKKLGQGHGARITNRMNEPRHHRMKVLRYGALPLLPAATLPAFPHSSIILGISPFLSLSTPDTHQQTTLCSYIHLKTAVLRSVRTFLTPPLPSFRPEPPPKYRKSYYTCPRIVQSHLTLCIISPFSTFPFTSTTITYSFSLRPYIVQCSF